MMNKEIKKVFKMKNYSFTRILFEKESLKIFLLKLSFEKIIVINIHSIKKY